MTEKIVHKFFFNKKAIPIKWANIEDPCSFNVGDDLVPYLIRKLSGKKIVEIKYASSRTVALKCAMKDLIGGKKLLHVVNDLYNSFKTRYYLLSVGSIIQYYDSSRAVIWGSGLISSDVREPKGTYLALRGPVSKSLLKISGNLPFGDPAILLPCIYKPKIGPRKNIGLIPH